MKAYPTVQYNHPIHLTKANELEVIATIRGMTDGREFEVMDRVC